MHPKRARLLFALLMMAALAFAPAVAMAQHYLQTNLVSNVPGLAAVTDPDLVNAWGLARSATSPWWVNDNGTGLSTLYNAAGVKNQAIRVTVPPPPGSPPDTTSAPTGIVNNGVNTVFLLDPAVSTSGARFIFATEDGTISGWAGGAVATIKVNNSGSSIYKGLAIAQAGGKQYIYAANFQAGTVDVFDSLWASKTDLSVDQFVDPRLPTGYAPFNIQNINGDLIVTFAKVGVLPDELHGRGLGFVDKFSSDGRFLMRFQRGPWLNAPWGVALAPADFGKFSNQLLVGQFGSGEIAAYDYASGEFEGRLHGKRGVLVIDGLWGLAFGSGALNTSNGPANTLFFTAGPDDEENGLFGTLTAIPDDDKDNHDQDKDKDKDKHDKDRDKDKHDKDRDKDKHDRD